MNEQELREKIANILTEPVMIPDDPVGVPSPEEYADSILALIKEAGWVKIEKGDMYWTKKQLCAEDPAKGFYNE